MAGLVPAYFHEDIMVTIPRNDAAQRLREEQGDKFMAWLKDHGYNYNRFAIRCGIDRRVVRSWACGERSPPILLPMVLEYLEHERIDDQMKVARKVVDRDAPLHESLTRK